MTKCLGISGPSQHQDNGVSFAGLCKCDFLVTSGQDEEDELVSRSIGGVTRWGWLRVGDPW